MIRALTRPIAKLSILLLAGFMAIYFQVAWQYPIVDSFPLAERLIDPSFLPNDFYTNTLSDYSPRQNAVKIIVWIAQSSNLHYTTTVALLNILRIFVFAIALYFLYRRMEKNKDIAFIAFFFSCLSFLAMPNLPAWWPITYDLTASSIAGMFAIIAWVLALMRQVPACFILLSFAVYFHPLVGVHSVFIAILLYLSAYGLAAFVQLLKNPFVYVFGSIYFGVFLYTYLPYQVAVSDQQFITINAIFKHAHHFLTTHIDIEKWLGFIIGMLALAILFLKQQKRNYDDKFTLPVVGYTGFLILINFLLVDWYPVRSAISFIPYRAFPILVPIFVLVVARYAYEKLEQQDYCGFLLLCLPFLPYESVGLTWFVFPEQHPLMLPIVMLIGTLTICLVSERVAFFSPINRIIATWCNNIPNTLLLFPIVVFAFVFAIWRFKINIPTFDNQKPIYQWLHENTSTDAIVMAELNAANNQKIRLLSRRAIIVSKDFPFAEKYYEEWYERYQDVYEYQPVSRGRIDKRSEEELNQIMDKYGATILVRLHPLPSPKYFVELGQVAGEEGTTTIYSNKDIADSSRLNSTALEKE